jgi:hypothetical protein
MSETLLEKHEDLVIELARRYLDNMELELGRKYVDNSHEINPNLTDMQHTVLKHKHKIPDKIYNDLYSEFQKMEPTMHLQKAMDAFTASGGNVEIEPGYDEETYRLRVDVKFAIKDKSLDRIHGLSEMEHLMLKLNAMFQVDTLLSGDDPTVF